MRLLWVLLFLPAARNGAVQYWSRQKRSVINGIAYAWYLNGGQTWFDTAGTDGQVRFPFAVRLASREDCLNVMSVVFGLLFLPAAGWITKGPWKINGGWARYWAVTGGSDYAGSKRGCNIDFQGAKVYLEGLMARQNGFSIRLASRSGLFGCSVVGLLFLPAGQQGFCWSSTLTGYVGYAYVVRHFVTMVYPWGGVIDRLPIRLASR